MPTKLPPKQVLALARALEHKGRSLPAAGHCVVHVKGTVCHSIEGGKHVYRHVGGVQQRQTVAAIAGAGAPRKPRLKLYRLNFIDDRGNEGSVPNATGRFTSAKEALKHLVRDHWDDRLDAASCSPIVRRE